MKKYILLFSLLLAVGVQSADAGVIPGTIEKGNYTSSNSCKTPTTLYSPSGGYCYAQDCKVLGPSTCPRGIGIPDTCDNSVPAVPDTCDNSVPAVLCTTDPITGICIWGSPAVPDTCDNSVPAVPDTCDNHVDEIYDQYCGCSVQWDYPATNGTLVFTDYDYNEEDPTFNSNGNTRHLSVDNPQSCNRWANGTKHIPPTMRGTQTCTDGSLDYYIGGSDGVCNSFGSTSNLIISFDQVGNVFRSHPSDGDSICTVEWRYATPDDSGPSIEVTNADAFASDGDEMWCNMEKYLASTRSCGNQLTMPTGCRFYRDKNIHANTEFCGYTLGGAVPDSPGYRYCYPENTDPCPPPAPDMLENLNILVKADASGINTVRIELGSCDATYDFSSVVDNSKILESWTDAVGIKPSFEGDLTIAYSGSNTYGTDSTGKPFAVPSLLSKFEVKRLDDCLAEGKNYLRITATDGARSNSDGVTWAGNTSIIDYSGQNRFIRIDNSSPRLGFTGEAAKLAYSNVPEACYATPVTIEPANKIWKNFTISGGMLSGDPFGNNSPSPECNDSSCDANLSETRMTCTTSASKGWIPATPSASNHFIWTAPSWVDPMTGQFTGYTCNGLGPIPDTTGCDWGCASGYEWNGVSCTVPVTCGSNVKHIKYEQKMRGQWFEESLPSGAVIAIEFKTPRTKPVGIGYGITDSINKGVNTSKVVSISTEPCDFPAMGDVVKTDDGKILKVTETNGPAYAANSYLVNKSMYRMPELKADTTYYLNIKNAADGLGIHSDSCLPQYAGCGLTWTFTGDDFSD